MAPALTVRASVVLQVGEHDAWEKEAVTPLGREDAVKDTGPGIPEIRFALILVLPSDPVATETVEVEADKENCAASADVLKL